MPDITISTPSVNTEAYFKFKDPVNRYLRSRFNTTESSFLMKISSVTTLEELVHLAMASPKIEIYDLYGIDEFEYNKDLENNTPIITFKHTKDGVNSFIRVPANYLEDYSNTVSIAYVNKVIVIDLGSVYKDLDLTAGFSDLSDVVSTMFGLTADIKEVAIGEPEFITSTQHDIRETIRTNSVTVRKSLSTRLAELTTQHSQMVQRLSDLNISLG